MNKEQRKTLEACYDYLESICRHHGVTFMGVFAAIEYKEVKYRDYDDSDITILEVLSKGQVDKGMLEQMIQRNQSLMELIIKEHKLF